MPIYHFWGDDDFAIAQAVKHLLENVLDSNWLQFNFDKISGDESDAMIHALNRAMTPVFGMGGRLVWLFETSICHHCSEDLLSRLEQTLPAIPSNSHLLLTATKKPDSRLKSSKLLQKYANIQEFSLISPWKTEELKAQVRQFAKEIGVILTSDATQLLAESVGNNTRQLWNELKKLHLYQGEKNMPITPDIVATLVHANTQNSLQLANAIRSGNTSQALVLVADLINRNEPALKIVATLVGQFRTWTLVKLKIETGERSEKAIAAAADIANPNRIYPLRKELQSISSRQLLASFPILLDLELKLKSGADPIPTLQTQIVQLCQVFSHY